MKLKFLGTGSALGVPIWSCNCNTCTSTDKKNKRYRSSFMVEINNKIIIIDFGQDFRIQLIENNIKKIDYAFLTHPHIDHMGGYENLSKAGKCTVQTPRDVLEEFYKRQGTSREWLKTRNPDIIIKEFEKLKIEDLEIDTIKLEHKKDYSDVQVPCYGYLFKSEKFKFAYMSDYNKILEHEKIEGLDLIISDGNEMDDLGHGHVGINGSIEVYKKYKPKKMILTHLKHDLEHYETQEYVKKFGNIDIAYDGMEVTI